MLSWLTMRCPCSTGNICANVSHKSVDSFFVIPSLNWMIWCLLRIRVIMKRLQRKSEGNFCHPMIHLLCQKRFWSLLSFNIEPCFGQFSCFCCSIWYPCFLAQWILELALWTLSWTPFSVLHFFACFSNYLFIPICCSSCRYFYTWVSSTSVVISF